jgi:hypothetical protein
MSEETQAPELVHAFGKDCLAEVVAYFREKAAANLAHDNVTAEAEYAYNKLNREAKAEWEKDHDPSKDHWNFLQWQRDHGTGDAYGDMRRTIRAHDEENTAALAAARAHLKNSRNPIVVWIEANTLDNEPTYSEAVLRRLPVDDPAQLWNVKNEYGMCREFDRLFAAAELEGVFTGGTKLPGVRELSAFRNKIQREYSDEYATDIYAALQTSIKAIREGYDAQLAEAKAEWQGLDEAWRSERSRRAAATRAGNREAVEQAVEGNTQNVVEEDVPARIRQLTAALRA